MKIRKGFISNSSSTSFICDVCAETVSGMDMGLDEAEMYTCENGHTFCNHHAIHREELEDLLGEDETDEFDLYEMPEKYCPCCSFDAVSIYDLTDYLLKKVNMEKDDVAVELRNKFNSFGSFQKYIKGKKNKNG